MRFCLQASHELRAISHARLTPVRDRSESGPFRRLSATSFPLIVVTRRFAKLFSIFRNYLRANFYQLLFFPLPDVVPTLTQTHQPATQHATSEVICNATQTPRHRRTLSVLVRRRSVSLSSASSGRRFFFASITRFFHYPLIATKWPQNPSTAPQTTETHRHQSGAHRFRPQRWPNAAKSDPKRGALVLSRCRTLSVTRTQSPTLKIYTDGCRLDGLLSCSETSKGTRVRHQYLVGCRVRCDTNTTVVFTVGLRPTHRCVCVWWPYPVR